VTVTPEEALRRAAENAAKVREAGKQTARELAAERERQEQEQQGAGR